MTHARASPLDVRTIIQARMSSGRFPGKVLAPLGGRPVIAHVLERVAQAVPRDRIVVATSDQASDDPLALYVSSLSVSVFRGDLENVLGRFQACLRDEPAEWFLRISADSPFHDPELIRGLLAQAATSRAEVVTNTQPRTFPKGRSLECVRVAPFLEIDARRATAEEREHVTPFLYHHPERFRVLNVESGDASLAQTNLCVDTIEDLKRLETLLQGGGPAPSPPLRAKPKAA